MKKCIIARSFTDSDGYRWAYDCGWRIINNDPHPYRLDLGGYEVINTSIGILEMARELGVIPARCK